METSSPLKSRAVEGSGPRIRTVEVSAFTIPTDAPEADGTFEWDSTTIVTVEIRAGDKTGFGFTYADTATATLIRDLLATQVLRVDSLSPEAAWIVMYRSVRNLGREGIASMAISAVDIALWDLKARLLGQSLVQLLGQVRDSIPVYGSGGFTSYTDSKLQEQLSNWVEDGITAVKIKIGTHPERDVARVRGARSVIGDAALYVDANGAYSVKQAIEKSEEFAEYGVSWFEEPVSSDDLAGLRLVRGHAPAFMEIAAGEYGYTQQYFRRMLESGAVDVIQADATRCGGVTGFLKAANEANAFNIPLSAHTAPSIHGHLCCTASRARNVEYFHDHIRIEQMLLEGALVANGGVLMPDLSAPGLGLRLKKSDAAKYIVFHGECNER